METDSNRAPHPRQGVKLRMTGWERESMPPAQGTAAPPSVERALTILEEIARWPDGLRLTEVVRRIGLPKSSAHALLFALIRRGYVWRGANGRYLLSTSILDLADVALPGLPLRHAARPILLELCREVGLSANVAVLIRDHAVVIDNVSLPGATGPLSWYGRRLDLHCTALGKALLAFSPTPSWRRLINERGLPQYNANTISSPRRLLEELSLTRERGFAVEDQEYILGLRCVASPVLGKDQLAVGALGVTAALAELPSDRVEPVARVLAGAAGRVAQLLADKAPPGGTVSGALSPSP